MKTSAVEGNASVGKVLIDIIEVARQRSAAKAALLTGVVRLQTGAAGIVAVAAALPIVAAGGMIVSAAPQQRSTPDG